jgi:cyclase
VLEGKADAIAMADILHYDRATLNDIRSVAITAGIEVRDFEYA